MKDVLIVAEVITSFLFSIIGLAFWGYMSTNQGQIQNKLVARWLPFWILGASMCCVHYGFKTLQFADKEAEAKTVISKSMGGQQTK